MELVLRPQLQLARLLLSAEGPGEAASGRVRGSWRLWPATLEPSNTDHS